MLPDSFSFLMDSRGVQDPSEGFLRTPPDASSLPAAFKKTFRTRSDQSAGCFRILELLWGFSQLPPPLAQDLTTSPDTFKRLPRLLRRSLRRGGAIPLLLMDS